MKKNNKRFFLYLAGLGVLAIIFDFKINKSSPEKSSLTQIKRNPASIRNFQVVKSATPKSTSTNLSFSPSKTKKEEHVSIKTKTSSWKDHLHEHFKTLGAQAVTTHILSSQKLMYDGVKLNTHTLSVKINLKDSLSSQFKVLIDSNNGKILRTWDRPIFERQDSLIDAENVHPLQTNFSSE